ncbi:hypothetical protein [Stenotrophomonas sp. PS02298]|uniref:hypothetical protein n=1 Tax=Stenotrophomonas sp. PS02298 TaxID=2991424 RepID=UPI00249CACD9|nr:hypothetical protein [Stenotrophomonas sp. PS02298]
MPRAISQGLEHDLAEQLSALDTRFLLAIHHGDVDVQAVARRLLAERGIDGTGRWVGFAPAAEALRI